MRFFLVFNPFSRRWDVSAQPEIESINLNDIGSSRKFK